MRRSRPCATAISHQSCAGRVSQLGVWGLGFGVCRTLMLSLVIRLFQGLVLQPPVMSLVIRLNQGLALQPPVMSLVIRLNQGLVLQPPVMSLVIRLNQGLVHESAGTLLQTHPGTQVYPWACEPGRRRPCGHTHMDTSASVTVVRGPVCMRACVKVWP